MENTIEFKFRTNLRGTSCILTIAPFMDKVIGPTTWKVDIDDPEKILTVHVADPGHVKLVEGAIERAGYSCTLVN
jgi:hypothetical protein